MGNWFWTRVPRQFNEGKKSLFKKWCWENWISICKRTKLYTYLIPYTKINSHWIKDLKIRVKIIQLLEETVGVNLCDLGSDNGFLDMKPKAQATKGKKEKLDFIKIKNVYVSYDSTGKWKDNLKEWEKIFATTVPPPQYLIYYPF